MVTYDSVYHICNDVTTDKELRHLNQRFYVRQWEGQWFMKNHDSEITCFNNLKKCPWCKEELI